ncbi:MAG: hypothetical protein N5P05_000471 [Chroococcopsis gigantea SAG 12.99]|jgi:hypothetical protein|nr:pre-peptidase C-terminal domain-containing protein [Chlorogloea purpurea SAG 13.99]MDV2998865.1 hypothetical protein [Chroococcopsis gigantea SAG 12.99]
MSVNLFDVNFYRQANPDLVANGLVTDQQLTAHFFQYGIEESFRKFSPTADLNFYRASNQDLANNPSLNTNRALYDHLSNYGVGNGRAFSPFFSIGTYTASNPDLVDYAINKLQLPTTDLRNEFYFNHFNASGLTEGRNFSQFVDLNYYKTRYSDLAAFNNKQLLTHLEINGLNESRVFSPVVDMGFYFDANQDLRSAYGPNLSAGFQHLQLLGINEQRRFSSFADLSFYQAANQDLRVNIPTFRGLFDHLTTFGINENRRFSLSYDTNFYRASNPDLAPNGVTSPQQLLQHFQIYGLRNEENRTASDIFNATAYLATSPDLQAAGFDKRTAQQHFERIGYMEPFRNPGISPFPQFTTTGDTIATSSNVGVVSSQRPGTLTASLNAQNNKDMYKLIVPFTQTVNFTINGYTGNLNAQLIYDANGNGVYDSGLTTGESIGPFGLPNNPSQIVFNRTLGAGTYYVLLTGGTGFNSSYNFSLSADNFNLVPNFNVGDTLGTAYNIGTVSNNIQTVTQFVGSTDSSDIYSFNVASSSKVKLNLTGLTGLGADRVNLQLIQDRDNNGQIDPLDLLTSVISRTNSTTLAIEPNLVPGNYFVRVALTQTNGNTGYSLSFST